MLTVSDIIFTSILPLIVGMSVAVFLGRFTRPPIGPSIGALLTLIAGYLGRFAVMDFAYADGETVTQKVVQSLSQTATRLLGPSTAIQWIPIFATAALATTIIVARVGSTGSSQQPGDTSSPNFFSRLVICGLLVALTALAIVRFLWTSVYFSASFTWAAQIGYVVVPAFLIGAVWAGAFCARGIGRNTADWHISRWASVSTLLLSASALVLLASSGSLTIGLLQIPALSAAMVSAVFYQSNTGRHAFNGDAWLIATSICFPVAIGFFFAQLRWEAAVLFAISSILVAWMPPLARANNAQKVCTVVASCLPAIAAAIWAAIVLSQTIATPYGGAG